MKIFGSRSGSPLKHCIAPAFFYKQCWGMLELAGKTPFETCTRLSILFSQNPSTAPLNQRCLAPHPRGANHNSPVHLAWHRTAGDSSDRGNTRGKTHIVTIQQKWAKMGPIRCVQNASYVDRPKMVRLRPIQTTALERSNYFLVGLIAKTWGWITCARFSP